MISQEYRGSQARVNIALRNVGAADITGLQTSLGCSPPEALRSQLSKIPQMLGAGGSSQLQLMIECMQCYQEPPTLALDFSVGGRPFRYDLPLPCMCFKFIEQTAMGEPDFNNSWNKMNAPGLEQSVVFTCAKPITPTLVAETLAALNLTAVPGVSPASAAGVLRTGTPTANPSVKISVGCLVRVEENPQVRERAALARGSSRAHALTLPPSAWLARRPRPSA